MDDYAEMVNDHYEDTGKDNPFDIIPVVSQVKIFSSDNYKVLSGNINKFILKNRGVAFDFKFKFSSNNKDFDVLVSYRVELENLEKIVH